MTGSYFCLVFCEIAFKPTFHKHSFLIFSQFYVKSLKPVSLIVQFVQYEWLRNFLSPFFLKISMKSKYFALYYIFTWNCFQPDISYTVHRTVLKLRKFSLLTLFWQKFRKSDGFINEVTQEFISRNIFRWWEIISRFSTLCTTLWKKQKFTLTKNK